MIIETGHFALVLALVLALAQAAVPMAGARLGRAGWMEAGRVSAGAMFSLVSVAFAALVHAYALSDFSVKAVAENTHTLMPPLYKIAAAWGGHEGSMLLWVWMLSLWGLFIARGRMPEAFRARALSFQGMLCLGFIAFILFASNPFLRLDPPAANGAGFNPVLQDPALALHPPLLYMGYVGFSAAFCLAMAALAGREVGPAFAALARPYALAALGFLTLGIACGAFWAYYELGWGGFWFWDPVENAALMPWLSGAALAHALLTLERRDALRGWAVFLSIVSFSLSLLGTFLVRSGILSSVHAFAIDPARGAFILVLLAAAVGGAFLLYAFRAPAVAAGAGFRALSREGMVALNSLFLVTFCATVLTGTLYPVVMEALELPPVSVGPPYYRAVLLPLVAPFALLMGAAPYVLWGGTRAREAGRGMAVPFALCVLFLLAPYARGSVAGALGFGAGGWILCATLWDAWRKGRRAPASYFAMTLAHAGFALVILGATAATQGASERILMMAPGDSAQIAGRTVVLLGVEAGLGPDYNVDRGVFSVRDAAGDYFFMAPERRWYPLARQWTSEAALKPLLSGMLYLVLGEADEREAGRRAVRMHHHPMVLLVFLGAALVGLGAFLGLRGRRA